MRMSVSCRQVSERQRGSAVSLTRYVCGSVQDLARKACCKGRGGGGRAGLGV